MVRGVTVTYMVSGEESFAAVVEELVDVLVLVLALHVHVVSEVVVAQLLVGVNTSEVIYSFESMHWVLLRTSSVHIQISV